MDQSPRTRKQMRSLFCGWRIWKEKKNMKNMNIFCARRKLLIESLNILLYVPFIFTCFLFAKRFVFNFEILFALFLYLLIYLITNIVRKMDKVAISTFFILLSIFQSFLRLLEWKSIFGAWLASSEYLRRISITQWLILHFEFLGDVKKYDSTRTRYIRLIIAEYSTM